MVFMLLKVFQIVEYLIHTPDTYIISINSVLSISELQFLSILEWLILTNCVNKILSN